MNTARAPNAGSTSERDRLHTGPPSRPNVREEPVGSLPVPGRSCLKAGESAARPRCDAQPWPTRGRGRATRRGAGVRRSR
eukprot:2555327-Prymnesium_polylepis.1